jgi:hypothetical protein
MAGMGSKQSRRARSFSDDWTGIPNVDHDALHRLEELQRES